MKAKALVMTEYNKPMEVQELELHDPDDDAIVVKIEKATICGTDSHIHHGYMQPISQLPLILGHEMVGRVEKLGKNRVTDVAGTPLVEGDRVIWAYAYCGKCYYCAVVNQPTCCPNFIPYGYSDCSKFPHLTGGFAQYNYILPNCHVVKVPEAVPSHWASSASCALRTIMHATAKGGGIRPSDTVLIQGSGPVGLYGVAAARAMGARRVVCFGAPENRLAVAKAWGADAVCNIESTDSKQRKELLLGMTDGRGADLVLECSGSHFAQEEAMDVVRTGGNIVLVGGGDREPAKIPPMAFILKMVHMTGIRSAPIQYYRDAVQFLEVQKNNFDFEQIFGNTYDLKGVNAALHKMQTMEEIKPIVDPFR